MAARISDPLSREESDKVYERQHVAAANRVAFQIALTTFTRNPATTVNFRNDDRAPPLFVAFPGVPGWEEVADHALEWASNSQPADQALSGAR
jgi:hypothetical protein